MRNSKAEAVSNVIDALVKNGFKPDLAEPPGEAEQPGADSGTLSSFCGRFRLGKAGTDIKCAVGDRTTCFYRLGAGGGTVRGIANLCTEDLAEIQALVRSFG